MNSPNDWTQRYITTYLKLFYLTAAKCLSVFYRYPLYVICTCFEVYFDWILYKCMDIQLTPLFDAATSGRVVTQYTQELLGAKIEHMSLFSNVCSCRATTAIPLFQHAYLQQNHFAIRTFPITLICVKHA